MADITIFEKIKQKVRDADIHGLITTIISGIGGVTVEGIAQLLYMLVFVVGSYIGTRHALRKNGVEIKMQELDLKLKEQELRSKEIENNLKESPLNKECSHNV
jgi:uncharacterized membrane protein